MNSRKGGFPGCISLFTLPDNLSQQPFVLLLHGMDAGLDLIQGMHGRGPVEVWRVEKIS